MIEIYQILIILAFITIIIEMFTGTLLFSALGFSFLVVAFIQYLFNGVAIERDLIIFAITMLTSIVVLRVVYKKKSDIQKLKSDDINLY
jgi:membrane protein implicated in regulation of membrane protease activity